MDKKIIILGVAAIGAAYLLSQSGALPAGASGGGGGEGAAGGGESKKDATTADTPNVNIFQLPPEATVDFPPPPVFDLASLLPTPPPVSGGDGTSKKDDSVLKVLVGPEYSTTPEVRAGTSGGSFGGFGPYGVMDSKKEIQISGQVKTSEPFDIFGIIGGILKWGAPQTAANLGYSSPIATTGTGAGGRAGVATTLGNISAVTKKDTTVGSSGVYTLSGAGVQSEYLTKSGGTQTVQDVTSAWLGLPSTGTGTIVPEGILTYQSGKSGPASDPVLISKKGNVIAGGSAGATLASLQKTAGMEAAAQAVTRAAQIASGYVVNSKGGLQKSASSSSKSSGGKK
jgi:hypothetical protein